MDRFEENRNVFAKGAGQEGGSMERAAQEIPGDVLH
jgi:hypothetical protein